MKTLFFFILTGLAILNSKQLMAQYQATDSIPKKVRHIPKSKKNFGNSQTFGGSIGSTSGLGISFRQWTDRIGFEITTLPFFSSNELTFMGTGISGLYKVERSSMGDFFLSFSGSYWVIGRNIGRTNNGYLNCGILAGLESPPKHKIGVKLAGGYGFYNITKGLNTMLAAEFGIYYRLDN